MASLLNKLEDAMFIISKKRKQKSESFDWSDYRTVCHSALIHLNDLGCKESRGISESPLFFVSLSVQQYNFCSPFKNPRTYQGIMHEILNSSSSDCTVTLLCFAGFKPNDKIHIFPSSRVLRQGSSAMFCCIPPTGVNVKRMTFRNEEYRLLSIGGGVKAITVNNLTIPKGIIKHLLLTCDDATGKSFPVLNYISCKFESFFFCILY